MLYPDIRIYDLDAKRVNFPVDEVDRVTWETIARGGFGQCTVTFKEDFSTAFTIEPGYRLEVWLRGALRYRGYIGLAELGLDLADQKTLTCYGLAERMNSFRVNKRYLYETAKEASAIGQNIWQDFIGPNVSGTATRLITCPSSIYDLDASGSAREAFDKLMDASGSDCVWGWEVNGSGQDQLYIIPKGTSPAYKFVIGGNVKAYSYPEDHTAIVNTLHLFGGKARWPNLLSDPSFDEIDYANEQDGNLLGNESFEEWFSSTEAQTWICNGIQQKTDLVKTGRYSIGIETNGDYVRQTQIPVTGGKLYRLSYYFGITASISPTGWPVDVTLSFDSGSASAVPDGTPTFTEDDWTRIAYHFTAPAGATLMTLEIKLNQSCAGVRIDDIALWRDGGVAAKGWKVDTLSHDSHWNGTYPVLWGAQGKPAEREHGYPVTVQLKSSGPTLPKTVITAPAQQLLSVEKGDRFKAFCYGRTSAGTCKATIFVTLFDDTTVYHLAGSEVTLNSSAWTLIRTPDMAGGMHGQKYCRVGIVVNNSGLSTAEVYLDSVCLFNDRYGDWDKTVPPYCPDWFRSDNLEWWIRTSDTFIQTDGNVPASVKSSIATFGPREAEENSEDLMSLSDAQTWAKRYFLLHATPETPQRLDLVGCSDDVRADGLIQVIGSGKTAAFPERVTHMLRAGADTTDVTVEMGAIRPTWDVLLGNLLAEAKRSAKLELLNRPHN